MRDFADLESEPGLKKFCDSPLGTLYMVLDDRGVPTRMLRHFDTLVPAALTSAYASLVEHCRLWIEQRGDLARRVTLEPLLEVGRDFVARRFHVYLAATRAYVEWEDPPEVPEELGEMRGVFNRERSSSASAGDTLLQTVLARSLAEPTGKTYFDEVQQRFVIVEPKILPEDVRRWSEQG